MRGLLHLATELCRHGLHAVANSKHGHIELEHGVRYVRRILEIDGLRSTRQHDTRCPIGAQVIVGHVPTVNFRIHAAFTNSSRNELRVLAAEIENQQPVGMNVAVLLVGDLCGLAHVLNFPVIGWLFGNGDIVNVAFHHAGA